VKKKVSPWHIKVAAEAFAAGLFARCGFDVSVQYGSDQPEYDLVIVKSEKFLKVSVKGSQDGSWGLTQSLIKNADYHGAVDRWLEKHQRKTIFCFVQFKGVDVDKLPRAYLATPSEVALRLKKTAKGRGDTILYEEKIWSERAYGTGTVDKIPEQWRFSKERVEQLLSEQ
jgi:hypothetical protein